MRLSLTVNHERQHLDPRPGRTLAAALRDHCGLTSPVAGCADGTCGACTVLVDDEAVRSCTVLAVQCEGARVITVEGLAADDPARQAVADSGRPCDSCRPGLIMLVAGDKQALVDAGRRRRLLASNVCRHAPEMRAD